MSLTAGRISSDKSRSQKLCKISRIHGLYKCLCVMGISLVNPTYKDLFEGLDLSFGFKLRTG